MPSIRYSKTSTGGERWAVLWRDAMRRQRSVTFDDPVLADLVRAELERDPGAESRILASVLDWAAKRDAEHEALHRKYHVRGIPRRSRTKLARRLSDSQPVREVPPPHSGESEKPGRPRTA